MALGISRRDLTMVAVLLTGTLLAVLNQTLLSPALPSIMKDMGVDATTAQWLTSGYSLVEAVVIPMSAYLIGRFTTRQLFIGAISIFAAGSLTAALAPNFWFLLLGRAMQALCTGMAMPMVMTVILLVFPREKRGTATGIIGLIIGFAPAVGPSVAGLLVDTVGWRVLFGIVFVLAIVVVVLSALTLRNYGSFERLSLDPPSVALASVGLVCLLYGLSTFTSSQNIALTVLLVIVGLILLTMYVRRQMKLPSPMLNVGILKSRNYATSVIIIVMVQAAIIGTGVLTPLYIQNVRGFSATMSGVAMLPGAVIGAVAGLFAGRLFDRHGVRTVAIPGILVAVVGGLGLSMLGIESTFLFITASYTMMTIGLQFSITPLNTWGINSLDNKVLQHAQSLSNTVNQVAGALGTALLVSISAMAPSLAPEASALEQSCLGDHLAFTTTAVVLMAAALGIMLFVRTPKSTVKSGRLPVSYESVADGVVVDAPMGTEAPSLEGLVVGDIMDADPVYVDAASTMREVMAKMAARDTSGVAVIDSSRRPVGFVTDGDVSSYLGNNGVSLFDPQFNLVLIEDSTPFRTRLEMLFELNVMKIATKQVISLDAATPIEEACRVLGERRIKKAPVLRDGVLVGTISRRNIVSALSRQL